jgi:hypothetical protein
MSGEAKGATSGAMSESGHFRPLSRPPPWHLFKIFSPLPPADRLEASYQQQLSRLLLGGGRLRGVSCRASPFQANEGEES